MDTHPSQLLRRSSWAPWILLAALAALALGLLAAAPIEQPAHYHAFADDRTLLGMPNFWNVVSNAPFLVVGLLGVRLLRRRPGREHRGWAVLFAGCVLVAFGSGVYHLRPDDDLLVWDRLPIGLAFMGFFSALVSEHVHEAAGRRMLWPAVALSIAAVCWWRFTGDLSLWIWIQATPMLATLAVVLFFPTRPGEAPYLAAALACYALAKVFEVFDAAIYGLTASAMSGHALKHMAAAAGAYFLYRMLLRRHSAQA